MRKVHAELGVDTRIFFHESRFLWWKWLTFRKTMRGLWGLLETLDKGQSLWSVSYLWHWRVEAAFPFEEFLGSRQFFYHKEFLPKHILVNEELFFTVIDAYLTNEPPPANPPFEWLHPHASGSVLRFRPDEGSGFITPMTFDEYFSSQEVLDALPAQEGKWKL